MLPHEVAPGVGWRCFEVEFRASSADDVFSLHSAVDRFLQSVGDVVDGHYMRRTIDFIDQPKPLGHIRHNLCQFQLMRDVQREAWKIPCSFRPMSFSAIFASMEGRFPLATWKSVAECLGYSAPHAMGTASRMLGLAAKPAKAARARLVSVVAFRGYVESRSQFKELVAATQQLENIERFPSTATLLESCRMLEQDDRGIMFHVEFKAARPENEDAMHAAIEEFLHGLGRIANGQRIRETINFMEEGPRGPGRGSHLELAPFLQESTWTAPRGRMEEWRSSW